MDLPFLPAKQHPACHTLANLSLRAAINEGGVRAPYTQHSKAYLFRERPSPPLAQFTKNMALLGAGLGLLAIEEP